jgi:hypothetical protein
MKNLLIQAFDEPNHTQTPNKFFDMIPDMSEAELRVTLVMIRHTLGYHKNTFKMGMKKIGEASGLTRQGAIAGAEAAERRGIFKRSNPESIKEAEWELNLLPVNVDDMSSRITPSVNVDDTPCNLGLQQVGVKENYKENNKEEKPDFIDYQLEIARQVNSVIEAQTAFEKVFGFGVLNWDSRPEWRKFSKWVVSEYQRDPSAFSNYVSWRNDAGKYKGMMTNPAIRRDPQMFMDTGWPTFLAHVSMYANSQDAEFGL